MKAADIENLLFSDSNMKNVKLQGDRDRYIKHLFDVYGYKLDSSVADFEIFANLVKHNRREPKDLEAVLAETKRVKKPKTDAKHKTVVQQQPITEDAQPDEIFESEGEDVD